MYRLFILLIFFGCHDITLNKDGQSTKTGQTNVSKRSMLVKIQKYEPLASMSHFYELNFTNDSSLTSTKPNVYNFYLPDSILNIIISRTLILTDDSINYEKEMTGIKICVIVNANETCVQKRPKNAYDYLVYIYEQYEKNKELKSDTVRFNDILEVYKYQYFQKKW